MDVVRNRKPVARARSGQTRRLPSANVAISPRRSRTAQAGVGSNAGRRSARPMERATSACLRGSGADRLIGPRIASSSRARSVIRTASSSAIQLTHCVPGPTRPPAKRRNGSVIKRSAGAPGATTRLVLRRTTRMPRASASLAASSQSRMSRARNVDAGAADSVAGMASWPSYTSVPDALMKTRGRRSDGSPLNADTNVAVGTRRLSRRTRRRLRVHHQPPTLAPARFTTASASRSS